MDVEDEVIIETYWLCRGVIGPVMSPSCFPVSAVRRRDGTATKEELSIALRRFSKVYGTCPVDPDAAIRILCRLGVGYALEGRPGVYQFPALVVDERPAAMWAVYDRKEALYVGRRLRCKSDIEIIAPSTLPLLQARAAQATAEMISSVFKGGVHVVRKDSDPDCPTVEAMVTVSDGKRMIHAIDVVARSARCCSRELQAFLESVLHLVMRALDDRSPGTAVERLFLSPKHIRNHAPDPLAYTEEEIQKAEMEGGVLYKAVDGYVLRETVDELFVDVRQTRNNVLKAVQIHGSSRWFALGQEMGFSRDELVTSTADVYPCVDKLQIVFLMKVDRVGKQRAEEELLAACRTIVHPIQGVVSEELRRLQRTV